MLTKLIIYSTLSGITIFLGGVLANFFNHHVEDKPIKYEITHAMCSFGGGIIISALALVLIPHGMKVLPVIPLAVTFISGAVVFYFIDRFLSKKGGKIATLLAMLIDFIPESIALGAIFVSEYATAKLLAIFIGLQNLPEAFNAFRDLVLSGFKVKKALFSFFLISFVGVLGALIGFYFLKDSPKFTAHLMIFASGGILYLIFQDIAPESKLKGSYITSLGATFGFLLGMIGEKLI